MAETTFAKLPGRAVVAVSGDEAEDFLQGLVTADLAKLAERPLLHAALLTPQGKIQFEFFIQRAQGWADPITADPESPRFRAALHLDVAAEQAADVRKRLMMYRLRRKIDIEDVSDNVDVIWITGAMPTDPERQALANRLGDPRDFRMGPRWIMPQRAANTETTAEIKDFIYNANLAPGASVEAPDPNPRAIDPALYHDRRVELGIAEIGHDYAPGDAFPHDVNFDLTGTVDFKKGCFVGQEVVSRMRHKALVRRRTCRIVSAGPVRTGQRVTGAGGVEIGSIGTVHSDGRQALAILRLDKVAATLNAGLPVQADGFTIEVDRERVADFRETAARHLSHDTQQTEQ